MDKSRKRAWDSTEKAREYRNAYRREHYSTVGAMLPVGVAKAYREACKRLGVQTGDPIRKVVQDVLDGHWRP